MRFNKRLSQLEAVYQIAPPVVHEHDKTNVSDFVHHIFENTEKYKLSDGMNEEWFVEYVKSCPKSAIKFVSNLLESSGHIVDQKCILEGLEEFKKESSDEG